MSKPFCTHGWLEGDCPYCEVKELKLQNREYLDHIEWAWGVIANAGPEGCLGNWKKLDPEWVKIAENWRDKYHKILDERRVTEKRKEEPKGCDHRWSAYDPNNSGDQRMICRDCGFLRGVWP